MSGRIRAAAVALLSVGLMLSGQAASAAAEPRPPDLGMAPLDDLVVTTSDGRQLLRFSAMIVNVGAERFELIGSRSSSESEFTVSQRMYDSTGAYEDVSVGAELVFGGDGHSHWHVKDLETYELERLDNGVKVGTGAKSGFCFFDTDPYRLSLPGAPSSPQFDSAGCGEESALQVAMGLSVGWGDEYEWTLPDQYIDITGLVKGRYRLRATADDLGMFSESDSSNNETWVDVRLANRHGRMSVKVLGYGPSA